MAERKAAEPGPADAQPEEGGDVQEKEEEEELSFVAEAKQIEDMIRTFKSDAGAHAKISAIVRGPRSAPPRSRRG